MTLLVAAMLPLSISLPLFVYFASYNYWTSIVICHQCLSSRNHMLTLKTLFKVCFFLISDFCFLRNALISILLFVSRFFS